MSFFLALRLRHDDDRVIAAGVGDQRQPDAGIAGGAFDDHPAWPQFATRFGGFDNRARRAVLDRTAGIEEFGLAQNAAAGAR